MIWIDSLSSVIVEYVQFLWDDYIDPNMLIMS